MGYEDHHAHASRHVAIAILTVSDTKGPETDTSGDEIQRALEKAGHRLAARAWARDEPAEIRQRADELLANADALVVTGGTGVSPRDVTVQTLRPRFVPELPGFGELFRALSRKSIGSGAILSRATAGIVEAAGRRRPVFLLPGSPDACELAVRKIIVHEVGHLCDVANGGRGTHG
jgi:molybdenum cofactor biosynthesis protein B